MRVVQAGPPWKKTFSCRGCQAQLEIGAEDVDADRFGGKDEYDYKYYVTCPKCGTNHFFRELELPVLARRLADHKYNQRKERNQ